MTDKTDPASPVGNPSKPGADPKDPAVAVDATGLTAQEHAAIMLRVPNSGTPWLDKMIVEARRMDAAAVAMQALLLNGSLGKSLSEASTIDTYTAAAIAASDSMARQLNKPGK
jgi:hypothetical protein